MPAVEAVFHPFQHKTGKAVDAEKSMLVRCYFSAKTGYDEVRSIDQTVVQKEALFLKKW